MAAGRPAGALPIAGALLVAGALLICAAPAQAYRTGGSAWPGRPATISVWNGTKYKSELRQAMRAWNTSGARVRFVPARRSRAAVTIGYARARSPVAFYPGGAAGFASIGRGSRNYVLLSRGSGGLIMTGVITHELGHVLGLGHQDGRCATMNSVLWSGCAPPGTCSLLQRDDVRGAVARYGGLVRRLSTSLCPPPPSGLTISPSADSYALDVAFKLPRSAGGYVQREELGGKCPGRPKGLTYASPAKPGQRVTTQSLMAGGDPSKAAGKSLCVRVWAQSDGGRLSLRPVTRRVTIADQRPPAPASLTAAQEGSSLVLRWPAVTFSEVSSYVVRWQPGGACPTDPGAAGSENRVDVPAGNGFGSGPAASTVSTMVGVSASGPVCFSVWSSDRFGRLSTGHATATAQAKLRQPPNAIISPPGAYGTVGDGTNTITFSDASTDDGRIVSRTWDFGDPGSGAANSSAAAAPSHTFEAPGSYVVTLTVTDDEGLTGTASVYVEIG